MNETLLMPLVALTIGGGVVSSLFIGGLIPGTFPYLSRQIRSLSKQDRLAGIQGLGRLGGEKALNLLCSLLNHHELDMRRVAVESLAMTGSLGAIEPLGTVLEDSNPFIRRAAALGLAAFDEPRATELLCQALKDSDEQVVAAAALAIAHRKDPASIEPLCRALSGSAEIARVISKALTKFGMEAFDTLCRLLPEAGAVSGERMIEVMREINAEACVEPLLQTLATARVEATVKAAIRALSALNPPDLLERLCTIVRDPQALGRMDAITALRAIDHPQGIAAIAQVLADPDPELRRAAVMALAGHSAPSVTEALCGALADPDADVVRYAAHSLGAQRDARILRCFFLALYPLDGEAVIQVLENALKRPLEELDSAMDFLPLLERWAGPSARQDDQTARYSMQSALILLHGRIVRGFRDLTATVLVFKGQEWSSVTSEERLHPLAASTVEFLRSPREVRQFQAIKAHS
jgi:HEAT repeat protein